MEDLDDEEFILLYKNYLTQHLELESSFKKPSIEKTFYLFIQRKKELNCYKKWWKVLDIKRMF